MGCENNCAQCQQYPCTCSTNFWVLPSGVNTLKGCECDPENPIRLQARFILHAIEQSQKARDDFNLLYPALFPCEQERFDTLFEENPLLTRLVVSQIQSADTFQRRMNNIPVHTAGPYGGGRRPITHQAQALTLPPWFAPKSQPRRCGGC